MAISLTPYPSIPAGYSSAGEQATSVKYTYVAKQGYFTINVNGLMPSTLHSVYFEGKKVQMEEPLRRFAADVRLYLRQQAAVRA